MDGLTGLRPLLLWDKQIHVISGLNNVKLLVMHPDSAAHELLKPLKLVIVDGTCT